MKKTISAISVLLFLIYAFVPLFSVIAWIAGYNFTLYSYTISAIVNVIFSIIACIIVFTYQGSATGHVGRVFTVMLLPMLFLNCLFYLVLSDWKYLFLILLFSMVFTFVYTLKCLRKSVSKIIVSVILFLLLIPLCIFSFVDFMFSDFDINNKVIKAELSPDKSYRADIIDSDQGALGGNTFVDVYDLQSTVDFYIFKLAKKPQRLYRGVWGEYQNMSVSWKDNYTLFINKKEYTINR